VIVDDTKNFRRENIRSGLFWHKIYIPTICFIALIITYLDLANYLYVVSFGVFIPKYIYYALVLAIVPIIILKFDSIASFLHGRYVIWATAMVSLNLVHWAVLGVQGAVAEANLTLTRLQFFVFSIFIGFLISQVRIRMLGHMFVFLALILVALQVFDFFLPGILISQDTEGLVSGRASSTLMNSNKAAESLLLLTVLGMAALSRTWRFVLLIVVFPGILLTFSRSGILAWSIIAVAGVWFNIYSRMAYLSATIIILGLLGIGVGLIDYILSYVDISGSDNILQRVMFFTTLDTSDDSTLERAEVARHAFDSFLLHPVFGNGSGYTHYWSGFSQAPHNQHLLLLAEYGIVGYAMFFWIIVILFKGRGYFLKLNSPGMWMFGFLAFVIFTPFTHNMFDNLYWLVSIFIFSQTALGRRK
jgi:hypothetical protein